jgi:hypothetical protein
VGSPAEAKAPSERSVTFDVDQYTLEQALNGLFHMLAEQETSIRTDPAARVTDLLKRIAQTSCVPANS